MIASTPSQELHAWSEVPTCPTPKGMLGIPVSRAVMTINLPAPRFVLRQ